MLFKPQDARKILLVWLAIFGGGFANLQNLPHLWNPANASTGEKIMAMFCIAWIVIVVTGVGFIYKRYRRGFLVAIASDGLLIHLPEFKDDIYPWSDITGAEIKKIQEGKPQIALVTLKNKKRLTIGGVANVFPDMDTATRFVNEVNQRTMAKQAVASPGQESVE